MLLWSKQEFAATGHDSFDANSLVMVTLRQATSAAQTVTVTNTGTVALAITSIQTNNGQYRIQSNTLDTVFKEGDHPMHREVNLTKRVQTPLGMRYCTVALSANGRVKPDAVLVNGKPERHPEGAYYIEWHDKGRHRRLSVGKDAADASSMRPAQRNRAEQRRRHGAGDRRERP